MSKFTVGQKVRVNDQAWSKEIRGETGTVAHISDNGKLFGIQFDQPIIGWTGPAETNTLFGHKLDAIQPTLADELRLPPQGRTVLNHMRKQGSISAADAMLSYGMTSAVLTRRVCDIENIGFNVTREPKKHPTTGRRYTRYSLAA